MSGSLSAGLGQVAALAGDLGTLRSSIGSLLGLGGSYDGQLQPASWRGQRFVVAGSTVRAGRRVHVHEYPFRDGVWSEDLGKRGRLYGFDGFISGDDVGSQFKGLLGLIEQAGPGELLHPTLGSRQCVVLAFEAADRWEEGGVWRFRVEFLEPQPGGLQLLPVTGISTQDKVMEAAGDASDAAGGGFLSGIGDAFKKGIDVANEAVATVWPYVATARQLAGDASSLASAASGLAGSFGRFTGGHGLALGNVADTLRTAGQMETAVTGAIGTATRARATVERAATTLTGLLDL